MNLPKFSLHIDSRSLAGSGVFGLTLLVLAMIYAKPELAENDLFKTLAQAIIVQGLIGLCMAYWFTAQHRTPGAPPVKGDDAQG